jgi:hypothetical protein
MIAVPITTLAEMAMKPSPSRTSGAAGASSEKIRSRRVR